MNARLPTPLSVVFEVIGILDDLEIRYHLGGSFASAIHGVPRQTMDADLVVDLDSNTVKSLVPEMERAFYVDSEVAAEAVSRKGSFNAIHLGTGFKVDFFVKGDGAFDVEEFSRSQLSKVVEDPPQSAYVKSPEDTVLRKLLWFRDGGEVSERQWRDVLGVLLATDNLDMAYLEKWAAHLDLERLLKRALRESEEH